MHVLCMLACWSGDLDLHATKGKLAELTPQNGLYPAGGLARLREVLVLVLVAGLV